jgi:two-component system sensor histidine kinase QseC
MMLVLATVTLVWLGATAYTYYDARHEFGEVLDAHLAQEAALLAVQAEHEIAELDTDHAPLLHKYARKVAFQIWEDGQLLRMHTDNAPQQHLAGEEAGFSDSVVDGVRWRVFTFWDESGEYLIHVAQQAEAREELSGDLAGNLLMPLLFSLPLLALLLWLAVTNGLRPLGKLAAEVGRRDPQTLSPLDASAAPSEVLPLIERLNQLFARIESTMQQERRFTADAAHELRTPVAAIKAQAQVARAATGDAERQHALNNAIVGCDRATHLIEQLLTLARADAPEAAVIESCRLQALAADEIASIAPAALERNIHIELVAGDVPVFGGNPGLLRVLLRNLVDNAVKHTPPGTSVRVGVRQEGDKTVLSVCDDGQGIPEGEMEKVAERFYRSLDTQASGSGLGLSIVQRIAEVHRASLQFAQNENGRGLCVTVTFPLDVQVESNKKN